MIERAKIQSIIDGLKQNSRIEKNFCDELDKSFDSKTLFIGVVGIMKAGKSSLVNSFVFGDEILPSAVKTTTVTLTEITYSKEEKVIVELMTSQDIEDLKAQSEYNGNDTNLQQKAKVAAETLESLSPGYEKHLNTSKQIKLSELPNYIDAEGQYSGLAKSVKIFISNENLKGVTIIDTPGFNDPIASRGETTKNALRKCHVLLFVHSKDGYTEADVSLLVEQIKYAGVSEIVDVLNKIDMLDVPIEEWQDELNYFIQKRNEIKISDNDVLNLLSNSPSTYVSSLMALCGLIPYEKMSENMKEQFSEFEEDFEELCQADNRESQQQLFVKYSNVNAIINEINRLSKEGSVYLVEGPLMTLKGKLSSIKNTIDFEIEAKEATLKSFEVGIEASKKSLDKFEDFITTVMRKVQSSSLVVDLSNLVSASIKKTQDLRKSDCSSEFTEERYPDPTIGSRGVGKANIASYNTFVSGFENSLRDLLNNLKDSFSSECKKEINGLITSLSTTSHVDKERMEVLKKSLINSLQKTINDIYVIVPSKRLSYIPKGNQKHWDLFRTHFLEEFDDSYLCNLNDGIYSYFSQAAQSLNYVSIALTELDNLRKGIIDSMNKSPQQKKTEVEKIRNEIEALKKETKYINSQMALIDDLKKNVKSNS